MIDQDKKKNDVALSVCDRERERHVDIVLILVFANCYFEGR